MDNFLIITNLFLLILAISLTPSNTVLIIFILIFIGVLLGYIYFQLSIMTISSIVLCGALCYIVLVLLRVFKKHPKAQPTFNWNNFIHDEINPDLLMIRMSLSAFPLENPTLNETTRELLKTTEDHLKMIYSKLRFKIDHSDEIVTGVGLEKSLHMLIDQYKALVPDIHFDLVNQNTKPIARHLELLIYQCLKEIIFNAIKHSSCDQIQITLQQTTDGITILVKDNGSGVIRLLPGFGINKIQERLQSVDSELNFKTKFQKSFEAFFFIHDRFLTN